MESNAGRADGCRAGGVSEGRTPSDAAPPSPYAPSVPFRLRLTSYPAPSLDESILIGRDGDADSIRMVESCIASLAEVIPRA